MTIKPAKKPRRMGRPPLYGFDVIREGGRKFIATTEIQKVKDAARKYSQRKHVRLKVVETDDGRGVDVKRLVPKAVK